MHPTLDFALQLLACPSLTPDDAGCHDLLEKLLVEAGFDVRHHSVGEVKNLWASHGSGAPHIVLAGHCDVVPTGPLENWTVEPFNPVVKDGFLYGRGAADMKGSLGAMALAAAEFVRRHPLHKGTVSFLSTSDEEGAGKDGTKAMLDALLEEGVQMDVAFVGEPTSTERFGDAIKVGRRGSLTGLMKVRGKQGHVAYPHLAENAVHALLPFLSEMVATEWDNGDQFFDPTTFQITNIKAGTGAVNVVPGEVEVAFNHRFGTASPMSVLKERIAALAEKHGLAYDIKWLDSAHAFQTTDVSWAETLKESVEAVTGEPCRFSTEGGTSDARFFAAAGIATVELGPLNATIHAPDECIPVTDLEQEYDVLLHWLTRHLS